MRGIARHMSYRKHVYTHGFLSWYLSMATIQNLPLADFQPCDGSRSVIFTQQMSRQFLKRAIIKNLILLFLFFLCSTYAIFVYIGYLPTPTNSSGRKLLALSTWMAPPLAFATAVNIAVVSMFKNYRREVRVAHDGSLHANDKLLENATLVRSKITLHDSSYFPECTRSTEAICLKENGKILVLATRDVRSDLDEISQSLGISLDIGEDIIEINGVV